MEKKEKKTKLKLSIKGIIILVVLLIFLGISIFQINTFMTVYRKGYSVTSSIKINKAGLKSKILEHDYSKLVDQLIHDGMFVEENFDSYFLIDYTAYDGFGSDVNKLLEMKYTPDQINMINKKNDKELLSTVKSKYISDIDKYIEYNYFKLDKLDRYISYNKGDYKDAVISVNIGLDKEYYTDPTIVKEYSINMIVNKYNSLEKEYVPKDLVKLDHCSEGENYLAKDAKEAYDKLCDASKKDGLNFGVTSSYRSYSDQEGTWNYYLKVNGQDYANKYVARPGFSEHQTGLALDVKSTISSPFKTTKEYKWMLENAYKYGFILRYPENKESITGFNSEAWHFRYVGVEVATKMKEENLTYEEYCAMYL